MCAKQTAGGPKPIMHVYNRRENVQDPSRRTTCQAQIAAIDVHVRWPKREERSSQKIMRTISRSCNLLLLHAERIHMP